MKPQEIIRDPRDAAIGLDAGEAVRVAAYGRRAGDLARLSALGLPVPPGAALSFDCVRALAAGGPMPELPPLQAGFLVALRSSPEERAWGGAAAILNLGATDRTLDLLAARIGPVAALRLYARCVSSFGQAVHGLDPEDFEALARRHLNGAAHPDEAAARALLDAVLALYEAETDAPWLQDPAAQIEAAARAMARAWNAPSARILRRAKGASEDAGLGLVVQRMALALGRGACGSGHVQLVDSRSGAPDCIGDFRPQM
jgi:pyruvate,orthophosphate dikinase